MTLRGKLSRIFAGNKSIKNDYSMDVPSLELSSEKKEEIIEKITLKVKQYGLKTPAILFLRSFKPASVYGAQLAPSMLGPFFMLFEMFDIEAYNYNAIFMSRENVDKLLKRIEEI